MKNKAPLLQGKGEEEVAPEALLVRFNNVPLVIDEVSLCDRPACAEVVDGKKIPRSVVAVFKRDTNETKKEKK